MKDSKYFPAFVAPFQVPNSTEFQSLDPNSNAEPLIVPAPGESPQTKNVVTVNARAFIPVVLDSSGKNVTYLPPNSNYTMDGTESYVNSGWLWPEGQAPPRWASDNQIYCKIRKTGHLFLRMQCSPVDDRRGNSQVAN